jgi:predicted anti-sigma-YlaC factor YlaD
MFGWTESGCRQYRVRMEDHVGSAPEIIASDIELDAHLRRCERCRQAFAAAQLSGSLFSAVDVPEVPATEAFVTRVMASIREQEGQMAASSAVWRPLEVLASRFALVAAVVLLALSFFLGEFAPAFRQSETAATPTQSEAVGAPATEISSDWPEPPAQPATQDEVLMSLVDVDNGI